MKTTLMLALLLALASHPVAAQPPAQPDVWRTFAGRLEVGSRIKVRMRDGERVTATLVQAAPEALLLQPRTRTPVPVQRVSYEEIVSIERDDQRGIGAGKAVAIGVASGVATFFGIMLIMLSALD
jgi:hypothetical protein